MSKFLWTLVVVAFIVMLPAIELVAGVLFSPSFERR